MANSKEKTTDIQLKEGHFRMTIKSFGDIPIMKADAPQSNIEDPFQNDYSGEKILAPPYNPLYLARMTEVSDILGPLIKAMITNVHGFGWDLVEPEYRKGMNKEDKAAQDEWERLNLLFNYVNPRQDLTLLRKDLGLDYYSTGAAPLEVVRNRAGEIAELYRLPNYSVRLTAIDNEPIEYQEKVRDEGGQFVEVPRAVRFRKYVQIINGTRKIYFKEFGDPRLISAHSGKEVSNTSQPATEVIFFRQTCAYSPYGVPGWIGCLMGIVGSRKAEEVNYLYFDNKTIPPFIISVSGGELSGDSVQVLRDIFEREVKGVQNFHRAIILQAEPFDATPIEGEGFQPVRIDIKPLTQFMQKDVMFGQYLKDKKQDLASSFRMAPMYYGRSDDYTRATAREAVKVMEEQVFEPERRDFDYIINRTLLSDLEINYWTFRSLGAKTTDDADVLEALQGVQDSLPISVIWDAVGDLTNRPMPDLPEEMAQMTVGELRRSLSPVLPGQTNTEEPPPDNEDEDTVEKAVTRLIDLRKRLQQRIDNEEM